MLTASTDIRYLKGVGEKRGEVLKVRMSAWQIK